MEIINLFSLDDIEVNSAETIGPLAWNPHVV